jgi:hypothetical protein
LGWCGDFGYGRRMRPIRAVLIDIDGVLTISWKPLPGAVEALQRLRAAGFPLALVTSTTSRSRASIASALAEAGFPVSADDNLTAPVIAAAYLQAHYPDARCLLLNSGDIGEDLAGLALARQGDPVPADVVLAGGAGPEFRRKIPSAIFRSFRGGNGEGCSSLRVRSRVTRVSEFLGESAEYRKGCDRSLFQYPVTPMT